MNTWTDVRRVVVADDDEDMRAAVAAALQADGCITVEARDGRELLDLICISFDQPWLRPDVIVTDVKMPTVSGLGVLAALQCANCNLPVVMITAAADEYVDRVARRLGAVGVLHKPFDLDDLVTAVRNAKAVHALHH
jgi:CheY-like chemotaxis protein